MSDRRDLESGGPSTANAGPGMGDSRARVLTAGSLILWLVGLLIATLLARFVLSLVGQASLSIDGWRVWDWGLWDDGMQVQIWQHRMFRLTVAAGVGFALASSGLALQGLLRNPLAEPYILGMSSGAGVGVLAGMVAGASAVLGWLPAWALTPALAMAGAVITAAVVYGIAQRRGRLDPYVLLLAGVIVNVFNAALILAIVQFLRQEEIVEYMRWSMGQVPDWLWAPEFQPLLWIAWAVIVVGWLLLLMRAAAMNALGLGDEVAASTGVGVHRLRIETFVIAGAMTAAAVALAGPIGFVGLIVPHVCRMLLGADHRRLAVVCGFAGAIFLMAADTLCRVLGDWLRLGELPVGVVTALAGGPFFIVLLRRRGRGDMA